MPVLARLRRLILAVADKLAWLPPLVARLTLGIVFVGTGWGKLHSLPKVTAYFTELHIPAPAFNAALAASAELGCGALLLIGFLSRLAALPLLLTMTVAIVTAKRGDLDGVSDLLGFIEFTYIVLLLWIAVAGPGPLSIDRWLWRLLGRRFSRPGA